MRCRLASFAWQDEVRVALSPLALAIRRGRTANSWRRHEAQANAGQARRVRREDYVYVAPVVEIEHTVFFKTIIPSRGASKRTSVKTLTNGD
jgi:hypothetical protein